MRVSKCRLLLRVWQ